MEQREINNLVVAIIVLTVVIGFSQLLDLDIVGIAFAFAFAFIIIATNVIGKKIAASKLDANVNHEIWHWQRYGLKPKYQLKTQIPLGLILPLILSALSLGIFKLMTILSYETSALKRRAARRFGHYSFTEMTDWHNGLIGAAGILTTLLVSLIAYFIPGLELLAKFAAYYAFFNMVPFSQLDGCHIYFGSRPLWTFLAILTLIFTAYAIVIV